MMGKSYSIAGIKLQRARRRNPKSCASAATRGMKQQKLLNELEQNDDQAHEVVSDNDAAAITASFEQDRLADNRR